MLDSKLRLFIGSLLTTLMLHGGVLAATVDGSALIAMGLSPEADVPADSAPDLDSGDLHRAAASLRIDPGAAPVISPDNHPEIAAFIAEPGFILFNMLDTKRFDFSWRRVTAADDWSAGWQILLPRLPDTKFRHLLGAQFSPTFLMFATGLAGMIFLARCRPRRRGQLGLTT